MLNNGMPYDPIPDQGRGGLKVAKMAHFKVFYLLHQYECNQKTIGRQHLNFV